VVKDHGGEALVAAFGPAKLDSDVVSFLEAGLAQAAAKRGHLAQRLLRREPPLNIPDYTTKEVVYHIKIMSDGGLISYSGSLSGPGGVHISRFGGLRWQGHEFLDGVRDPRTWEATKKTLGKVGGVSLQIAMEIARAYLRTHLPF
jgi:hypothetical protein